jgi:hypothetical protein
MGRVGIWASGLLASAIPFVLVGAVITFAACMFEAVGQHPAAHSELSFQPEATPPEQVLAFASVEAPDHLAQRQPAKHAHSDARHNYHAGSSRQSRSHSRVRHSSLVNGGITPAPSYW